MGNILQGERIGILHFYHSVAGFYNQEEVGNHWFGFSCNDLPACDAVMMW
jgi:hypothetical protein